MRYLVKLSILQGNRYALIEFSGNPVTMWTLNGYDDKAAVVSWSSQLLALLHPSALLNNIEEDKLKEAYYVVKIA